MSIAIEIRYPWGRVHATPWGRNTNEGSMEWPPAPRRILRAIYAAWKTRHPELDEDRVHPVLEALAVPPEYGTDEVRYGSTRHYLALDDHTAASYKRGLALDAFVCCRPDRGVIVSWDVELGDEERDTFEMLVRSIPFLGRAESICEIEPTTESISDRPVQWSPLPETNAPGGQTVDLLVADAPLDLEALTSTPSQVRRSKRLHPPGSRQVPYVERTTDTTASRGQSGRTRRRPTAIRWLLDAPHHPHERDTVVLGHVLRQAALRRGPDGSPVLAGKGPGQHARGDQHRHAHYLVFGSSGTALDSAVIWAPEGFDADHVRGLASIENLVPPPHLKGIPRMRAIIEGVGCISDVAPELSDESRVWRTRTPFVITRYPKDKRPLEAHVAEQVQTELDRRDFPAADVSVEVEPDWRRFRRHRPDGSTLRTARPARFVHLAFDDPVPGPISLGSLSHFGLGLFCPAEE